MKCRICYVQKAIANCSDCGRGVCSDCSAAFPHHDPPHHRCELCYYGGETRAKRKRRDRGYDEYDDSHDADWWKR